MVTLKQAATIAVSALKDTFGQDKPEDVRFEEFELDDSQKYWLVTLSFLRGNMGITLDPAAAVLVGSRREYKVVKIEKKTGKIDSIKIRTGI